MALAATTLLLPSLSAAQYALKTDLSYKNFFSNFNLFSDADPTHGFVQYQNYDEAIKNQYVGYLNESIFLGVDYKTKDPNGRASIRAESTVTFDKGLLVADIAHMPSNECGTWPALWLLGTGVEWPNNGEIDILEGVNDYTRNSVTLHTNSGCMVNNSTMSNSTGQSGTTQQSAFDGWMSTANCDVAATDQAKNVGCSIMAPAEEAGPGKYLPTYGAEFNAAGGGVYALEWTDQSIQAWFFPRNSTEFASATSANPDPSQWGTPLAKFQGSCNIEDHFKNMTVQINVSFCGDWAGSDVEWNKSCAKKTGVAKCEDYVRDHPEAFESVYWEIKGLKWFEKTGSTQKRDLAGHAVSQLKNRAFRW
ncbi:glycoside hydrolase family 16 protein [Lophiostoma macrostomum CBS 122681]|uniref:Glycoside hydrolase family 16 protein n=1 Tax=Lophiostoma macrostomum CBS 122681 TaxID=1314788 RepID=A0A6A6TP99_9PLEO|nr:glycoside hydrolase family 16 protein [Lophiostoma macrostomum CBS 122681]